ncbi:MAG: hypothetical protein J3K34DRAFT_456774 [Monoraphidium minutum]|nr:MAG: hypothetical protein J3K34DRAFT_456774 [Monoraphidium minutum]
MPPLACAAWLLLVAAAAAPRGARAQMQQPFQGGGGAPPALPTAVHVSAFLDRLLVVDDDDYAFEAVLFIYLSWNDPRAKGVILSNGLKILAGNHTCQVWCQSQQHIQGGCCDGVWTPYLPMSNIKGISQDVVARYGFGYDGSGAAVFQWRVVQATWYTPMNLRAFPFDRQHLKIQFETPSVKSPGAASATGEIRLIPSASGSGFFSSKGAGDDVSDWKVHSLTLRTFEFPMCQGPLAALDHASGPTDPAPIMPAFIADSPAIVGNTAQCAVLFKGDTKAFSPMLARSRPGSTALSAVMVQGINIDITVDRLWRRYVVSAIFPVIATTWLGYLVFLLPRKDMESRLGAVVALFLALAAIQFVIDSDLPSSSYITAMQMLTLASYFSLVLIGLENILIWGLSNYHENRERLRQHKEAGRALERRLSMKLETALVDALHRIRGNSGAEGSGKTTAVAGDGVCKEGIAAAKDSTLVQGGLRASLDAARRTGDAAVQPDGGAGGEGGGGDRGGGGGGGPLGNDHGGGPAQSGAAAAALREAPPASVVAAAVHTWEQQHPPLPQHQSPPSSPPPLQPMQPPPPPQQQQQPQAPARGGAGDGKAWPGAIAAALASPAPPASAPAPPQRSPQRAPPPFASPPRPPLLPQQSAAAPPPPPPGCGGWACCRLWARARVRIGVELQAIKEDPAYADRMSHRFNKWACILQFSAYNAAAVLIFAINANLWRS